MNRKVAVILLSLMMLTSFNVILNIGIPLVNAIVITVDDDGPADYSNIQDAIDAANPGDTVLVYNGTYYENVVVNKTINLTGEHRNTTIIDASFSGHVIHIMAFRVNITGFTITNCGIFAGYAGIKVSGGNHTIFGNEIINNNNQGIYLSYSDNNSISNNNISNNEGYGINVYQSSNNDIIDNVVTRNKDNGIFLSYSDSINNRIIRNVISRNFEYNIYSLGSTTNITANNISYCYTNIHISSSNANVISDNIMISYSGYGISISNSLGNYISNNTMMECGIVIFGNLFEQWNSHTINTLNTVNHKPVYYLKNQTSGIIPANVGQVILANCTNIKIENQTIANVSIGIELGFSSNISIINNNISYNLGGIYTYNSFNSSINNNEAMSNWYGIYISYSTSNIINFNNASSNSQYGIYFYFANENSIIGNYAHSNKKGIVLGESNNNNITCNNVSNNQNGIYFINSFNNTIFHNNFLTNEIQAFDDTNNGNQWDNGYPFGGNFWSNYNGSDEYNGPNQDIPGNDGIGDTNYSIDINSADNYPLMSFIGFNIFLHNGWNLVSIPFILSDTNLNQVLSTIQGAYDAVQWLDAADPSDPWKHNCTTKTSYLNDLNDIDHIIGFWIHITEPRGVLFQYFGTQPTSNQSIPLYPGWNMVGYPSLSNKDRDIALNNLTYGMDVDSIWTFNAASQKWENVGPSDSFELGRGYWIHATQECQWEVPL